MKMEKTKQINKEQLLKITAQCDEHLNSKPVKLDALKGIAAIAVKEFGQYFGPNVLTNPDELSIGFIELLDQIVFEISDNKSDDNNIRDYIIDDLLFRAGIYIEAITNIKTYKNNFHSRAICFDDMIVIKYYSMDEYISHLVFEFNEQPHLQEAILKTLITFQSDDLLKFYSNIINGNHNLEIKGLALMGLKKFQNSLSNWNLLKSDGPEIASLITYVKNFNVDNIEKNIVPADEYSLYFVINYIEQNLRTLTSDPVHNWILKMYESLLNIKIHHSFKYSIYKSLSNIIIFFDINYMKSFANNQEYFINFIKLIDALPREFFGRITAKLNLLGNNFINAVNDLISEEKIEVNKVDSNIMSFLLWKSSKIF
ncbi:hypothetical protein ACFL20_08115 [Spirochaetota bacterium]